MNNSTTNSSAIDSTAFVNPFQRVLFQGILENFVSVFLEFWLESDELFPSSSFLIRIIFNEKFLPCSITVNLFPVYCFLPSLYHVTSGSGYPLTSNVSLAVLPDDTVTDRLATSVVAAGPKETVGLNVLETGSRSSTSTVAEQLASPASDSAMTYFSFQQ